LVGNDLEQLDRLPPDFALLLAPAHVREGCGISSSRLSRRVLLIFKLNIYSGQRVKVAELWTLIRKWIFTIFTSLWDCSVSYSANYRTAQVPSNDCAKWAGLRVNRRRARILPD